MHWSYIRYLHVETILKCTTAFSSKEDAKIKVRLAFSLKKFDHVSEQLHWLPTYFIKFRSLCSMHKHSHQRCCQNHHYSQGNLILNTRASSSFVRIVRQLAISYTQTKTFCYMQSDLWPAVELFAISVCYIQLISLLISF